MKNKYVTKYVTINSSVSLINKGFQKKVTRLHGLHPQNKKNIFFISGSI
jgi:hypothetical protein